MSMNGGRPGDKFGDESEAVENKVGIDTTGEFKDDALHQEKETPWYGHLHLKRNISSLAASVSSLFASQVEENKEEVIVKNSTVPPAQRRIEERKRLLTGL